MPGTPRKGGCQLGTPLALALLLLATPAMGHGEPVSPGSTCHNNPAPMRPGTHCTHRPPPGHAQAARCRSLSTYLKNPIHAKAARRDMARLGCPARPD